jgi:DNA-binding Lrp family transcriptional regulator
MQDLDELDIRLLADLGSPFSRQWNVRRSYADLAKQLDSDEETIRLRLNRARERGYMPRWRIRFNPGLIGHHPAGIDLTVGRNRSKARAISQLRRVAGVVLVVESLGNDLFIEHWYSSDPDLDQTRRRVSSIAGAPLRDVWKGYVDQPSIELRLIDWRILGVMHMDARADLTAVAASLGVTVRTVHRRIRAMIEGKAIMLDGTPDVSKLKGLVCDFLIHSSDARTKRAADAELQHQVSRIGMADTSPEDYSIIGVACRNLAEADQIHATLKRLYRVNTVRMEIVRKFIPVTVWLSGQIRTRSSPSSPYHASVTP